MFKKEFEGQMIGYARTSREDQNLNMQLNGLRGAGIEDNFIFYEKLSALAPKRPQYDLALKRCRSGDCLVVYKLDRLGRSAVGLIKTIDDLKARGVHFKSLTEPFDTTTPMGTMMLGMMALLAQLERDVTSERTVDGIAAAKEDGRYRTRFLTLNRDQWNGMLVACQEDPEIRSNKLGKMVGLPYQTVYRYIKFIKMGEPFYTRFPFQKKWDVLKAIKAEIPRKRIYEEFNTDKETVDRFVFECERDDQDWKLK